MKGFRKKHQKRYVKVTFGWPRGPRGDPREPKGNPKENRGNQRGPKATQKGPGKPNVSKV